MPCCVHTHITATHKEHVATKVKQGPEERKCFCGQVDLVRVSVVRCVCVNGQSAWKKARWRPRHRGEPDNREAENPSIPICKQGGWHDESRLNTSHLLLLRTRWLSQPCVCGRQNVVCPINNARTPIMSSKWPTDHSLDDNGKTVSVFAYLANRFQHANKLHPRVLN